MIFGKSAARNERRFGKKGQFDPAGSGPRGQGTSERAQLAVKRGEEHKARKGVKTKGMSEDYETKKKEEIMGALKKRDLKQKVKEKIAADIIKRKGDVSKSDDRYAYESVEVVSEGPLGALAGGALGAAVGGPVGALAGAALGSKVDVLGGGKKKTKATKPSPAPKPAPKSTPNVDAEKAKAEKRARLAKIMSKEGFSNWRDTLDEKCWAGYEKKGMKTMFGKRYPNCVKKK